MLFLFEFGPPYETYPEGVAHSISMMSPDAASSSGPALGGEAQADVACSSSPPSRAFDAVYGKRQSIEDRCGDLKGSLRWTFFKQAYVKPTPITIFPFCKTRSDSDGKPKRLWRRHRLNSRRQEAVVQQYARAILSAGVMSVFRGAIITTVDLADGTIREFVAGATIAEAYFSAYSMEPDNPFAFHK